MLEVEKTICYHFKEPKLASKKAIWVEMVS